MKKVLFYLMLTFTICGVIFLAPQMATTSYADSGSGTLNWKYACANGWVLTFHGTITGFDGNGVPHGTGTITITDPHGNSTSYPNVPFSGSGIDPRGNADLSSFLSQHPEIQQAFAVWILTNN